MMRKARRPRSDERTPAGPRRGAAAGRRRGRAPAKPAAAPPVGQEPVVVLVGRPNVGKSTLFNRLTRSRQALVTDVPGTTRDRREGRVEFGALCFRLVDTGGMPFGATLEFSAEVEAQIGAAVAGADLVWVLLDAAEGLNPFDAELQRWVLRTGKPYRLVVNKADHKGRRDNLAEFYALGSERLHAISAAHGLGLTELLEATAAALRGSAPLPAERAQPRDDRPDEEAATEEAAGRERGPEPVAGALRVAFLGRPNVGKSSLVNRVLGNARMIVSAVPGTTREAVETSFRAGGADFVLVDTAGIRRRARTTEHLEKLGVLHSLGSLDWVQVAVLVVDATEPVAAQDARIASYILEHRRAVVVAMNKWDCIASDHAKAVEAELRERLRFLHFAPFVRTSALDGSGVTDVLRAVQRAAVQFRREIQTADVNRMVQAATLRFPPPAQRGSPSRIYYGAQVGREPPAFRFFTNHPKQIDEAYTRFFENQLRHHFGLEGTPIRIDWRGRREDPERAAAHRSAAGAKGSAGGKKAPRRSVGAAVKAGRGRQTGKARR